jgi:spore germination protein YaaH
MQLLKNLIVGLTISILAFAVLLGTWLTVFAEGEVFSLSDHQKALNSEISCAPPEGWSVYRVHAGDTLTNLADQLRIERTTLMSINCIESDITPGDTIYLPAPEATYPPPTCGPPPDWVLYPLEEGELLSKLAVRFAVDEPSIWHANCIDIHTILQPGMSIYVPPAQ